MDMDAGLRKLQMTQLEILQIVDEFCKTHHLRYSLYAGTLLGAVRHQGFIPWDDDLDICMPREDYDRLIELWPKQGLFGCFLQNKENAPGFSQSFSKIRKAHTTFLQREDKAGAYHTGIFIDIFPIDRIPSSWFSSVWFRWNCMCYQLFTREFVPSRSNVLVRGVSAVFLLLVPERKRPSVRRKLLKRITHYGNQTNLNTVAIETMASLQVKYPADMLDHYVELPFEGQAFMCFADWDELLKREFGNYMELPPESERTWKHHPIILDFEHDYGELARK